MNLEKSMREQFVFNYRVKKLIAKILQPNIVTRNILYRFFYDNLMKNKMKQFERLPLRIMVENTNLCDSNCIFCPHKKMKRKAGIMEMELFKKIVGECKKFGVSHMTIHGFGEPLLDKDFFKKIKYAKEAGVPLVTANTNGMYLTKEKINMIFESGLDEIYISFDAVTELTYKKIRPGLDFSNVERNILCLVREKKRKKSPKPKILLSFVESKDNFLERKKYVNKWKNLVDGISVSFLHNWGGSMKEEMAQNEFKRDPCRLLWTDLVVSWNGDVPLCCNDYENAIILGDVGKQSLKEIWSGEKLKKIREFHRRKLFDKITICKDCSLNYHNRLPWWGL